MSLIVVNGDNLELLKKYPDNYFDAVVTDPPYGLGKEPDAVEVMTAWATTGYHEIEGKGFMGKEWDAFVPQPVFWKEVFRVLKHGGHVVAFYGTRTYDWGVMAMRFAGFEVRDCIQWLYGSGFPKSHNISKAIDKMYGAEREVIGQKKHSRKGVAIAEERTEIGAGSFGSERISNISLSVTEEAKKWDGWGSALKPANEPIVLARKPLEKGLSIAENVLKWGTGGINIDGCRVGIEQTSFNSKGIRSGFGNYVGDTNFEGQGEVEVNGRFPANIILTHHPECECKGVKKVGKGERKQHQDGEVSNANEGYRRPNKSSYTHKNSDVIASYGEETVEDWNCHPDCPIKLLDEQSGNVGGDTRESKPTYDKSIWGNAKSIESKSLYNDKGGASRFFYVAKASKSERNRGLDEFEEKPLAFSNQAKAELKRGNTNFDGGDAKGHGNSIRQLKNFHPTVKPVKLMQYLVRLITPPNGKVLDPFCGSGTTGVACKLEGFQFVGMEQDPEYAKIAEARIDNYKGEKDLPTPLTETNEKKYTQPSLF